MMPLRILMTGAGAPGAPGILRCYKNNGEREVEIWGCDIKPEVPTIQLLNHFVQIVPASDEKFISVLLDICIKNSIDIIQPLVTKELNIFAANVDKFLERKIQVCVSSFETLNIANNKARMLEKLQKCKIDVPDFRIINESAQFKQACFELGYPELPVCFKPAEANGSRGFRIIDNTKDKYSLLFNEKPDSTYIEFESANDILCTHDGIPELIVMEYLPGKEYSVDILADNGNTICAIPRRRDKLVGGISTNCVTENNQELIQYCKDIVKVLKLDGNIGIQARYDKNNSIKILEINPRVQGSIVNCAAAGANLPYLAIKQKLGEDIPDVRVKWGIEMKRYWSEVYYDHGHAFTY
ncbi:ATP-grasp domain-containing protein [Extibacter muris]|uniref:ATP-grasp domain-containing protein n=1 Tax=Extibacter muris TaxID=1796622 RepID=UPI001D06F71E|nr:ATP-grasp domain-containing protein [Extibacter muris]MCB6203665.1 ATP-grasp domain-containing protein [Extibacter muris]MCQ4665219.1 ATP-grasp domain-containing protein [Extibacter muris]MCQ4694633.1 ATP-grasp domain-containing protein [Extibacter muris]